MTEDVIVASRLLRPGQHDCGRSHQLVELSITDMKTEIHRFCRFSVTSVSSLCLCLYSSYSPYSHLHNSWSPVSR